MSLLFRIIMAVLRAISRGDNHTQAMPVQVQLKNELMEYGAHGIWQSNQSRIREKRDSVFIDGENIETLRQRLTIYDAPETWAITRWFTRLFTSIEKQRTLLCYWVASKLLSFRQQNDPQSTDASTALYYQNILQEHAHRVTSSLKTILLAILELFRMDSPKKELDMSNRTTETSPEIKVSQNQPSSFLSGIFNWFDTKEKTFDEVVVEKSDNANRVLLKSYDKALKQIKELYADKVDSIAAQETLSTQLTTGLNILEEYCHAGNKILILDNTVEQQTLTEHQMMTLKQAREHLDNEHQIHGEKLERAWLRLHTYQTLRAVFKLAKRLRQSILQEDTTAISHFGEIIKRWLQSPFEWLQSMQYLSQTEEMQAQKKISSQLKACLDRIVPSLKENVVSSIRLADWFQVWYSVFPKEGLRRVDDEAKREAETDKEKMLEPTFLGSNCYFYNYLTF